MQVLSHIFKPLPMGVPQRPRAIQVASTLPGPAFCPPVLPSVGSEVERSHAVCQCPLRSPRALAAVHSASVGGALPARARPTSGYGGADWAYLGVGWGGW